MPRSGFHAALLATIALLVSIPGPSLAQDGEVSRIYLANDEHTDYFWAGDDLEYRDVFLSMLDYYMQQADDTAGNPPDSRARFNCDGSLWVWEYEHNKSPAEFQRLIDHIRAGTISMPLHTLVELYGAMPTEAVLRNMYYAGRLERAYNLRFPLVAAIENQTIPGGVASLWAGSGARYAWKGVCGCATSVDYGDRPREIYHFLGPDGQSVCMKWNTLLGDNRSIGGYAEARYPVQVVDIIENDPDFTSRWPWPVAGAFGYGWDGLESYTYDIVDASLDLSNANRRVIVSHEADFFQDFLTAHGGEIESFSGGFGNDWDLLTATLAEVTAGFKRTLEKLRTAEALATVVSLEDPHFMDGREIARDAAFVACGLFYDHDWTANGPVGEAAREQFQRDQLGVLETYVDALYDDALSELASLVPNPTGAERHVVFNPLSFRRTDVALLPIVLAGPFHVIDLVTGIEVPSQEVFRDGTRYAQILAFDIPPVGYRVYEIRSGAGQALPNVATVKGATMTNGVYSVTMGSRGQITSLIDLSTSRQWVATDVFDIGEGTGNPVLVSNGPVSATLRAQVAGDPPHESYVTLLHPAVDRVELESRVTGNFGGEVSHEFDFALSDFTLRHEEVGMIATAKHASDGGDYADENVRVDYLTANHFIDLSESNRGITLSNWDSSFFRFGNSTVPQLDTSTPRVDMIVGMQPLGSLGIADQGGDSLFLNRYALRVHDAYDASDAMAFALAHQNPLVATRVTGGAGAPLTATQRKWLFQDSDREVLLWSLKPAEEGITSGGVIARYWNPEDGYRLLTVGFDSPEMLETARATSHIETDIETIPVIAGKTTLFFQRQQIRTVRLIPHDLVVDVGAATPARFRVDLQAFPRPLRADQSLQLRFDLPRAEPVRLAIFDAQGRRVADVHDGPLGAGRHIVPWTPGSALSPGVYFGRIFGPDVDATAKIVITR